VRLEGLGKLKKFNDLIGNLTHDLPACSIEPTACVMSYFFKTNLELAPPTFTCLTRQVPLPFRIQNYAFLIAPKRLTRLTEFIFLDLITLIEFDEELKLRSPSLWNSPNLLITSSPGCWHSRLVSRMFTRFDMRTAVTYVWNPITGILASDGTLAKQRWDLRSVLGSTCWVRTPAL
jgi:hypothetical protein